MAPTEHDQGVPLAISGIKAFHDGLPVELEVEEGPGGEVFTVAVADHLLPIGGAAHVRWQCCIWEEKGSSFTQGQWKQPLKRESSPQRFVQPPQTF